MVTFAELSIGERPSRHNQLIEIDDTMNGAIEQISYLNSNSSYANYENEPDFMSINQYF